MTNSEMLKALEENPKRKARLITPTLDLVAYFQCGRLIWSPEGDVVIKASYQWEIIEPEPELVDFGTAFLAHRAGRKIRSEATTEYNSNNMFCTTTEKEIRGKWQIIN